MSDIRNTSDTFARFPLRLALVAVVALAVRVAYTLALGEQARGIGDLLYYHGIAGEIAGGNGFADPFLSTGQRPYPSALHPPGWPLVLGIASKLGLTSMLAHRLVGCVAGVATVVLIGLLGRRIAGERAGLIAAAIAALYPTLIAADGSLMSESLYGAVVALVLLLGYRLIDRPGGRSALALGAAIGAASLVRGEAVLFVPLLAVPLAWRGGRTGRVLRIGATVGATALVLLPWTVRNAVTLDAFVPISTNESTLIAGANCARTYRGENIGYWRLECISQRRTGLGEAAQAEIWRREGRQYAAEHAGRLVTVVVPVRVLRTFDLFQARRQAHFAEGRNLNVTRAGIVAFYGLALLAVIGAVLLRRRRQPLLVVLSPFVVVAIASAAGFGLPRFRHAAEIAVVVLAATTVDWLLRRRQAPRRSARPETSPAP